MTLLKREQAQFIVFIHVYNCNLPAIESVDFVTCYLQLPQIQSTSKLLNDSTLVFMSNLHGACILPAFKKKLYLLQPFANLTFLLSIGSELLWRDLLNLVATTLVTGFSSPISNTETHGGFRNSRHGFATHLQRQVYFRMSLWHIALMHKHRIGETLSFFGVKMGVHR